jgi:hypothetical protein
MQSDSTKLPSIVDGLINKVDQAINHYKDRIKSIDIESKDKEENQRLKDIEWKKILKMAKSDDEVTRELLHIKFIEDTEIHKVTRVSFYIRTLQDRKKLLEAFIKVKNKYFGEGKMRIYREFINNSNTSSSILNQITQNLYTNSNKNLYTNSNTIEIFIALAQHPHCNVELAQAIITGSENFDEANKNSIYIELAKHTHIYEAIASHGNTDCATLEKIIQAMNLRIRFDITSQRIANIYVAVAAHENTNQETLIQIFAQSQVTDFTIADRARVYIAVAKNHYISLDLLQVIFTESKHFNETNKNSIYIALAQHPHCNLELAEKINHEIQFFINYHKIHSVIEDNWRLNTIAIDHSQSFSQSRSQ